MFEIYADGILWVDPDGISLWDRFEAESYADELERRGYEVELTEV